MNLQITEMRAELVASDDDPPDLSPPGAQLTIDVICENDRWEAAQKHQAHQAALCAFRVAVKNQPLSPCASMSMALVLADGDFVQALNARFRRVNRPTNVLAFPANERGLLGDVILGDVIIARDVLSQEAAEKKITAQAHLAHLAAHGTLHLLGFDHDNDKDAENMEKLEIAILAEMGISNPYHFDNYSHRETR